MYIPVGLFIDRDKSYNSIMNEKVPKVQELNIVKLNFDRNKISLIRMEGEERKILA